MPVGSENLQTAFRRLIQALAHSFWQRVRAAGLSMPQLFAMRYIQRHQQTNISDLAKALGITNPAASQLLRRLIEQNYVLSEEDPNDRRNKRLRLTAKGEKALLSITSPAEGSTFKHILENLSPEESEKVLAALEILLAKLPTAEEEETAAPRQTDTAH